MSTFTYVPSYSSRLKATPRVRQSRFGDGYSQRSADGINTNLRAWSLRFSGNQTKIDAIATFLDTEGGVTSFDWTPPRGGAGKWICSSWDRGLDGYNKEVITAVFEEVAGE